MKKILVLILAAAAALLVYQYFSPSTSPELRRVEELADRFQEAVRLFQQAGRSAAIGGIDSTTEAGEALERIEDIRSELESLERELPDGEALHKARQLAERIRAFQNQSG